MRNLAPIIIAIYVFFLFAQACSKQKMVLELLTQTTERSKPTISIDTCV